MLWEKDNTRQSDVGHIALTAPAEMQSRWKGDRLTDPPELFHEWTSFGYLYDTVLLVLGAERMDFAVTGKVRLPILLQIVTIRT